MTTMNRNWQRTASLRLVEMCAWFVVASVIVFWLFNAPPSSRRRRTTAMHVAAHLWYSRLLGPRRGPNNDLGPVQRITRLVRRLWRLRQLQHLGYTTRGSISSRRRGVVIRSSGPGDILAWDNRRQDWRTTVPKLPSISDCRWITAVALAALLATLVAYELGIEIPTGVENVAFPAIVLLAVGLWFRPHTAALSLATLLVLASAVAYAVIFHSGTGRLHRGSGLRLEHPLHGALSTDSSVEARCSRLGAGSGLWWLANERLALQESLNRGGSEGRTRSRVDDRRRLGTRTGHSLREFGRRSQLRAHLVTLPLAFLPSALTAGWAPQAVGYELVKITAPDEYNSGYSVASTFLGEWIFNFAPMGALFAVPLVVLGLRYLNRKFGDAMTRVGDGRGAMIWLAFWVMLCGGIADFTWSGIHTLGARFLFRLPLLIAVYVLVLLSRRAGGGRDPVEPRGLPPLTPCHRGLTEWLTGTVQNRSVDARRSVKPDSS